MAELAAKFDQRFIGFGAAIAEENFTGTGELDNPLCEPALPFVVVKIGAVDEDIGLPRQCFPDRGVSVAQAVDRDAATEVEIFPALIIPGMPAFAVRDGEATIGRCNDVLIVKLLDFRAHRCLCRSG